MKMFNTLSLRAKLILGFSLPTVLIVALSALVYTSVGSLIQSAGMVNHTYEALELGNGLTGSMVNMETGLRGYLITGGEEFLEPFNNGQASFDHAIDDAKQHVSDNPAQVARLETIDLMKSDWLTQHAEVAIAQRRDVNVGAAAAAHFTELSTRTIGKEKFDQLRATLSDLDLQFTQATDLQGTLLVQTLLLDMVNQETGQRGFLLTGKEQSLEPYTEGIESFDMHALDLTSHIEGASASSFDRNRLITLLDKAETLAAAWASLAAQPEIDARRAMNKVTTHAEDITAFIEKGVGKAYMDNIRGVLEEFNAEERALISVRAEESANTAEFATNATLIGAIAAIVMCFLLTFLITRNVLAQLGGEPQEVDDIARAIAAGNLNIDIDTQGRTVQGIFGSMVAMKEKLTEVVKDISLAAESVKTGAAEISQGNATLSQRTEEQASSLEETASSMEQMTATVKQNADSAREANQLGKAARDQAVKGGEVVNDAVKAMASISASSKKMADIIGVIDEIAFQTNLLALNASVEAARAGDQGRGFAVVASEVRNLAGRSATAAKEIKDLIDDSGAKVEEGGRLVNESGKTLDEIVNSVKKVTDILGEIAAARQEQASGIEEVNRAVVQMDELTQQNAALVEEAAAASESMGDQANSLGEMISFFTVDSSEHTGASRQPAVSTATSAPSNGSERRAAQRPWSGNPSDNDQKAPVAATSARKVANGADDAAWEEF